MMHAWTWFFGKISPSPAHTSTGGGNRKRDRLRLVFLKQKKHQICECLEEPVVAESTPQPQEETQAEVSQPEVKLDAQEPIIIEEIGKTKEKNVENLTLLELLRLGWMKSVSPAPSQPEQESGAENIQELSKIPQSLYLLHDFGHASSTTEITAVTGMQA